MDSEGFIYLVDRKKDIVITGGENIYPVEVEEAIHSHPKVYDVAVIGIPDARLGEIAAAIIDPKPGDTLTEAEINAFCEQNLAKYNRPRRIIFDEVPRSAGRCHRHTDGFPPDRHVFAQSGDILRPLS
ncbi:2-succinylbenzoate--CoA ligase [subsurface metagenome]